MAIGLNVRGSSFASRSQFLWRLSDMGARSAVLLPAALPSRLLRSGYRSERVVVWLASTEAERHQHWAIAFSAATNGASA